MAVLIHAETVLLFIAIFIRVVISVKYALRYLACEANTLICCRIFEISQYFHLKTSSGGRHSGQVTTQTTQKANCRIKGSVPYLHRLPEYPRNLTARHPNDSLSSPGLHLIAISFSFLSR